MARTVLLEPIRKNWRSDLPWVSDKFNQKGTGSNHTRKKTHATLKAIDRKYRRVAMVAGAETYDSSTQKSSDLYGFIDLLYDHDRAIQACRCGSDWTNHIDKFRYEVEYNVVRFLSKPYRSLELWGWYPPTKTRPDWWPRIQLITLDFLAEREPPTYLSFGAMLDGATPKQAVMDTERAA